MAFRFHVVTFKVFAWRSLPRTVPNDPLSSQLPMSDHKEEGGFVSKARITGLIYLADRLHLRYLYRTRLTKVLLSNSMSEDE